MKNYRIGLIILSLLTFVFTSCEDEVLDKTPRQSFSEAIIWSDIENVKMYVWTNYNALGEWYMGPRAGTSNGVMGVNMPAAFSDDVFMIFNYGMREWNTGNFTPDAMGALGPRWGHKYEYIRRINVFLNEIDELEGNESEKVRLTGEMKFLRAWCYHDLISLFGGVPLITDVFELDENFSATRESYQECVNFVIDELNAAYEMVPETVPDDEWGRITKGAVLSLKSRVLLYAASKLYETGTEPTGPLFDYDKATKWQDAADAAKAVIDMNQYSLAEVDTWKDYQEIFLHPNSEIILAKPNHPQYAKYVYNANLNKVNSPNGYYGWSGNCPTQNLVDEFPMKDGLSIQESPLYNSSADSIYENRGLRFYANIVYNGAFFRGREAEFFLPGGLDSQDGREPWNYAKTGYTMRKWQDESFDFRMEQPTVPYIIFRLAEFYLNYAEAQYHLGNEEVAREYVNMIRSRVHLPGINSSGDELLDDIRHERRIELCFEPHRFWDVRRWMIADEKLNENAIGIAWKKVNEAGELDYNGELTYEFINCQDRAFYERMYFLPIPREEIERTTLQQNPGYD